jgi:hypothetical protein
MTSIMPRRSQSVHLPSGDTEAASSGLRFERGARLGVESQVVVTERGHSHDCLIGRLHGWRPKAAVGLVTRKPSRRELDVDLQAGAFLAVAV